MTNHEAVTVKDKEILKKNCREDDMLPAELKDHHPASLGTLEEFESMQDKHLGHVNVAKHVALLEDDVGVVYFNP